MIHARKDYNRIQDPAVFDPKLLSEGSTPIGTEEPVFLLRCRDVLFIGMLRHYKDQYSKLCASNGVEVDPNMIACLDEHIARSEAWDKANKTKIPDVPSKPMPWLFRPQRGGLQESMAVVKGMSSFDDLVNELRSWELFGSIRAEDVSVTRYGFDVRIGWDTYLVCVQGCACGYTNGPVPEASCPE